MAEKLEEYKKGAIEEVKRVAALFSGNFTQRQYAEEAKKPYGKETIRWRLKLNLNEVKKLAELSVVKSHIKIPAKQKARLPKVNRGKITERICNVQYCDKAFKAVDDMRSCPSCTNIKLHGRGAGPGMEIYTQGAG